MFRNHSSTGQLTSDPEEILQECRVFYSSLYQSQISPSVDPSEFLQGIPTISEAAKTECDRPVTEQELYKALCSLKKNTSPGPCGWSPEFFIAFWHELGPTYTSAVHEAFQQETLPPSFTSSVTTLIPKKYKDRRSIENLRPISLLSVTYKIIAKVLASRIAKVADTLIHSDQTGFIRGRYIGENVRMILDLLKYTEDESIPGLIVQCDYYKAYDCVEWRYINCVMESVGFGHNFLRWMRIFYPSNCPSPYYARISMNNFLSQPYSIERGIRQGCPLSCLVWAICIEPMACKLRIHPHIHGVTVHQEEVKLALYADDTTIVLDGSEDSLRNSMLLVNSFCEISGLKLNTSKTVCLWIGSKRNSRDRLCQEHNLAWTNEPVTILGVQISTKLDEIPRLNYDKRLSDIKKTLTPWLRRSLTPFGRCIIVKSLALSKLTYLFSVLPSPDSRLLRSVEREIFGFVWGSKPDKVKRSVSKNLLIKGGLKVPDVYLHSRSMKISWIKRWLNPENEGKWKLFVHKLFSLDQEFNLFECALDEEIIENFHADDFWKEVLLAWVKLQPNTDDYRSILKQPIQYNKHLKLEQHPNLNVRHLMMNGLRRVEDLFSVGEGKLLSALELAAKYPNINFVSVFAIKAMLPTSWCSLEFNRNSERQCCSRLDEIKEKRYTSKWAYNILLQTVTEDRAPSQRKWESELSLPATYSWRDAYSQLYSTTSDIYLRWLQYRIFHRVLPTKKLLHVYGIAADKMCCFCQRRPETIAHIFYSCEKIVAFRHALFERFERQLNQGVCIQKREVIFGTRQLSLNLGLLLFKAFVWKQCRSAGLLTLTHFKAFVKVTANVQWHVSLETGKQKYFVKVWRPLCEALQVENSFFEPP